MLVTILINPYDLSCMKIMFSKKANAVALPALLIKKLGIPVSRFSVENDLTNHPEYPSMLAMSDCLTSWKIPHEAYRIDLQNFKEEELSYPFIAHTRDEGGRFILVEEFQNDRVKYIDEEGADQTFTRTEFMKKWDGIMLYAQKSQESGERNYRQAMVKGWLNELRLPFFVLIVLAGILMAVNFTSLQLPYLLLLAIKTAGISVSMLLLMHSINVNNPFIQNLCSLGKKNDCNAILKSEAAKITSWLSWSEVGMFYFAGSFFSLLIIPASVSLLLWLSLACLPYTFYSIGYQFKQKNWCILCCSVQALLWLEGLVFLFGYPLQTPQLSLFALSSIALCFLFPIAFWIILKPLLLRSEQSEPLKQQLKKFKYNSDLFNQLLTNQPRYAVSDDLMPISLGNQEAETVITMVSNPFCGPCATTHRLLEEWLEERDDIQLKVVFTTANQDDDGRTKVARHVTALSLLKDETMVKRALNDWYSQSTKNYETWAAQYPVSFNGEMNAVTERQKAWCEMTEIQFTPTILINGYKLVDPYQLEDIKYLLA